MVKTIASKFHSSNNQPHDVMGYSKNKETEVKKNHNDLIWHLTLQTQSRCFS